MTELLWDGKYDGKGRRVAPLRISLPFQAVETVNESAQERQRSLNLFSTGRDMDWRNRLIWGDKKYVLPALLAEFSGAVNLVYIDPPFATGQDFSQSVDVGDEGFVKEPSMIEVKAYRDTWGRGLDSYFSWLYDTAVHMWELLAADGSAYVHLGSDVAGYARALLDDAFGSGNFRNEIIWKRSHAHSDTAQGSRHYGRITDSIFFYAKSPNATWNQQYVPYDQNYVDRDYRRRDPDGRRYRIDNLQGPGGAGAGNPAYEVMGVTRHWRYSKAKMEELIRAGRVIQTKPGAVPQYKRYLDEMPGVPLQDLWEDLPILSNRSKESVGYPTQKPEQLLERIILTSSNEGDLVLDCFCGSGTAPVVAEKTGRRWIACDLSRFAVHTTRKRLLSTKDVRPFVVQNLGKYERQVWQSAEFGEEAEARTVAYRRFILGLFKAKPIDGYVWLHGAKEGRLVHVGTVDAPVTVGDVKQIAIEFKKTVGTGRDAPKSSGVDVLGWDFAFEVNEVARQEAAEANILARFVRIPREVLDKRAVEQGDVSFYELAALAVDVKAKGRTVTLKLTDFMIPLDDVPEDVQRAVKHWKQWIDYWAVDWDNRGDTFHNEWQTYRTRERRELETSVAHEYEEPGTYRVVVKVIDILGNDTTKTLKVEAH
jgi:adenine-specific DNA-methyltransferase